MLADELAITPHVLSQVLNMRIGKSFYVFVNAYRVEAVKSALGDPELADRGVLEIAFEAGFNSKSTLNSFFKRATGLTPSAYRQKAREQAPRAQSA
jgi:AraC-like DNA-binding protein